MANKIFIKTFGCQMNEYDSNRIFDTVKKIILSKIKPNPNQPRHNFNHDALNELTKSI